MNQRIKELAEQAADYANTYSDAGADVWFEMYNKKFAELIVRECISAAEEAQADFYVVNNIKTRFGVEE